MRLFQPLYFCFEGNVIETQSLRVQSDYLYKHLHIWSIWSINPLFVFTQDSKTDSQLMKLIANVWGKKNNS